MYAKILLTKMGIITSLTPDYYQELRGWFARMLTRLKLIIRLSAIIYRYGYFSFSDTRFQNFVAPLLWSVICRMSDILYSLCGGRTEVPSTCARPYHIGFQNAHGIPDIDTKQV